MELIDQPERWRVVTDQVMGGISRGAMAATRFAGADCLRLTGSVSTANNGGFVQLSCDLSDMKPATLRCFSGLRLIAAGHNDTFNVHLRTRAMVRPWESFRWQFAVTGQWREWAVGFDQFQPYRTDCEFDAARLVRIGIVAIGRDFEPELLVRSLALLESTERRDRVH